MKWGRFTRYASPGLEFFGTLARSGLDSPVANMNAIVVLTSSELDFFLTAQIAVAWAGESGEEPRMGWWKSDLVSEFGGQDLLQALLPQTWKWAVLQGAREVARRRDEELRNGADDSDRIISLYRLGFEIDERVDERLADLKRSGQNPADALPGLQHVHSDSWQREAFGDWLRGHGFVSFENEPIGRRLRGTPPESLELLINNFVAACWPLIDAYPMPHYRRAS